MVRGTARDRRILYVGRDADDAAAVSRHLAADADLRVETVTEPSDGLERVANEPIDCVVSAYDVRDRTGVDLLRDVRSECPAVPFVLFTGAEPGDIAVEAVAADVTGIVQRTGGREQYALLRQRVEDAVARHRDHEECRLIVEEATDGIVIHDPETLEILDANRRYCEIVDRSPSDLSAASLEAVSATDLGYTATRAEAHVRRAMETGNHVFEWVVETGDGSYRHVEVNVKLANRDGDRYVLAFVRDVSRRREYESTLTALHSVADDLAEAETVDAVCERSIRAAEEILEFDLSTIAVEEGGVLRIRATSSELPAGEAREMSVDEGLAGKSYRTGDSFLVDDIAAEPTLEPHDRYESALSVPLGGHATFQTIATEPAAFDESDLELAELLATHAGNALDRIERTRELRDKNDRLERFAQVVSHDLRNPLTVLNGSVELLADGPDPDALQRSRDAIARMDRLIDDLLALAQRGEVIDDPEPVPLAPTAETCWHHVETAGADLAVDADLTVRADPGQLEQLLENLFRNAVEHGSTSPRSQAPADAVEHGGPRVTVEALDDGFAVEDDGPGIPPGERERLFEEGYSTADAGTGFGLAIVDEIATAHGWDVRATDGTGGGARFEVTGVETQRP